MLTLQAFAAKYDVDEAIVRRWIRQGLLPAFRVGRVTRIAEEDEDRFRRLHTWHGGNGGKGRSAGARSRARASDTTTGEQSFLEGLDALSTKRARSVKPGAGSRSRSDAEIVDFPSKETA